MSKKVRQSALSLFTAAGCALMIAAALQLRTVGLVALVAFTVIGFFFVFIEHESRETEYFGNFSRPSLDRKLERLRSEFAVEIERKFSAYKRLELKDRLSRQCRFAEKLSGQWYLTSLGDYGYKQIAKREADDFETKFVACVKKLVREASRQADERALDEIFAESAKVLHEFEYNLLQLEAEAKLG